MSDLDLSPLLYPELFTEREQAHAEALLKQDPDAQAELERLLLARQTLEELGAQRAARFAELNPLNETQRRAVLNEARIAAQERATQGASTEPSPGLWAALISPQLAWVGVLSLALISLWKLQDPEMQSFTLAPVEVEPLSAPSPTLQAPTQAPPFTAQRPVSSDEPLGDSPLDTLSETSDKEPTPATVTSDLERAEVQQVEQTNAKAEAEAHEDASIKAPDLVKRPIAAPKPIKAQRRARAKRKQRKQRRRPATKGRRAARTSKAKPRSPSPAKGARRAPNKKVAPLPSSRSSASAVGSGASRRAPAPPPSPPSPAASAQGRQETQAQLSAAQSSDRGERYAPPPPQEEERSALDKSFPDSAEGAPAQPVDTASPWVDALKARAAGQAQEGLRLLERWLNSHMSHPRAREAAKLGARWALALKDQRAQRRFIAYDRALSGGRSPTKSSARPKRAKTYDSLMEPKPASAPSADTPSSLGF